MQSLKRTDFQCKKLHVYSGFDGSNPFRSSFTELFAAAIDQVNNWNMVISNDGQKNFEHSFSKLLVKSILKIQMK